MRGITRLPGPPRLSGKNKDKHHRRQTISDLDAETPKTEISDLGALSHLAQASQPLICPSKRENTTCNRFSLLQRLPEQQ